MTDTFVLIGSITYAMKARKIVKEHGIDAQIVKHDTKRQKRLQLWVNLQSGKHHCNHRHPTCKQYPL